jgi:8-oxo-dGTP diphosphatase
MKMIDVTCAIIEQEGKVLVTQRSSAMDLPHLWEFPGGKVSDGEKESDCIRREIQEELKLEVEPIHQLASSCFDYGPKVIRLIPFVCQIKRGGIKLLEHQAYKWAEPEELMHLPWCPADLPVIATYLEWRQQQPKNPR